MKNLLTILTAILFITGVAKAQSTANSVLINGMNGHPDHFYSTVHSTHHEKSGPQPFWIDLDSADAFNQAILGNGYTRAYWYANMHYLESDTTATFGGLIRSASVSFDTLIDSYNYLGPTPYLSDSFSTVFVDSIFTYIGQVNHSGIDDTLICKISGVNSHGYPTSTIYWSDTIIFPASLPLDTIVSQISGIYWGPNIQLLTNRFNVALEYYGSTLDSFVIFGGHPIISNPLADTSSYHPNSYYYNVQFDRMIPNPSGIDSVYYLANNNTRYQYGNNGADYLQNFMIIANVQIGNATICSGLYAYTIPTNASCNTCANGTIAVTAMDGASPYSYVWNTNPVQTTQTATGLLPGTYSVTVTDSNNCTTVATETVINNLCVGFTDTVYSIQASCATCADGSALVYASGGTSPYSYVWNTSPVQTTDSAGSLLPGNYIVTITDNNSCVLISSIAYVSYPIACSAYFTMVPDTAQLHTFYIINQASGIGPLLYDWNWGDSTADDSIAYPTHTYADTGLYTICLSITDSVGCQNTYCLNYDVQRTANTMATIYVIPPVTTGIKAISKGNIISLLPNPNDGNFILTYHLTAINAELRINDITGRMVHSQLLSGTDGSETITANIHAGIYLWEIIYNNEVLDKGKMAVMK